MKKDNKYYSLLHEIITHGRVQQAKKGESRYLLNHTLEMSHNDLVLIFDHHPIARKKLQAELELYMQGEENVAAYRAAGIPWWDYAGEKMVNTYPKYMKHLPGLIAKINKEKSSSKNYMLHLGETNKKTSQQPCLATFHFQLLDGELYISVHQRSCDASLGLPSDIYQTWLMANMIDVPLNSITFFISNAHIYQNNWMGTINMLKTGEKPIFNLNT